MKHGFNPLFLADLLLLSICGVVARAVMLMLEVAAVSGRTLFGITLFVVTGSGILMSRFGRN